MIQDLETHQFRNEYNNRTPLAHDMMFVFRGREVLVKHEGEKITFPTFEEVKDEPYVYLFSIDEEAFFLTASKKLGEEQGYTWENINILRELKPRHRAFAGITAYHLFSWYNGNRYCGRCGHQMIHSEKERALSCSECGNIVYPRISPAIIVGVTHGDQILMTKYAGRDYKKYALVAGFCEIGEAAEKTVEREVMEEVGLKVKNIRYYKSQPWGFSGDLLLGFFAEVDGDTKITMDESELAEATWISRQDIEAQDGISLTSEMMMHFKNEMK